MSVDSGCGSPNEDDDPRLEHMVSSLLVDDNDDDDEANLDGSNCSMTSTNGEDKKRWIYVGKLIKMALKQQD